MSGTNERKNTLSAVDCVATEVDQGCRESWLRAHAAEHFSKPLWIFIAHFLLERPSAIWRQNCKLQWCATGDRAGGVWLWQTCTGQLYLFHRGEADDWCATIQTAWTEGTPHPANMDKWVSAACISCLIAWVYCLIMLSHVGCSLSCDYARIRQSLGNQRHILQMEVGVRVERVHNMGAINSFVLWIFRYQLFPYFRGNDANSHLISVCVTIAKWKMCVDCRRCLVRIHCTPMAQGVFLQN